MRQVGADELAYAIADALRRAPRSLLRLLDDRRPDEARRARARLAGHIAVGLGRFEVLCERELPLMGEATFSRPIARMLGEDVPSGAIPAPDDAD